MTKIIKYIIITVVIAILIFQIFIHYNINQEQIAVLVYHNIVQDEKLKENDQDALTVQEFDEQLEYLKNNGYTSISLDELYRWKKGETDIPEKSVVITFDDGYYSFKYLVQPILQKYNFNASCFLIGDITGSSTPKYEEGKYGTIGLDEVKNKSENITYGSHTFGIHRQTDGGIPLVKEKSYEELKDDTQKFNSELFDAKYLAYPYYTYTKDYVEVLEKENYKLAFAGESEMTTKNVNNYKIPRISGVKSIEDFKDIFETDKYRNKYGNGLIRKICLKIERTIIVEKK